MRADRGCRFFSSVESPCSRNWRAHRFTASAAMSLARPKSASRQMARCIQCSGDVLLAALGHLQLGLIVGQMGFDRALRLLAYRLQLRIDHSGTAQGRVRFQFRRDPLGHGLVGRAAHLLRRLPRWSNHDTYQYPPRFAFPPRLNTDAINHPFLRGAGLCSASRAPMLSQTRSMLANDNPARPCTNRERIDCGIPVSLLIA